MMSFKQLKIAWFREWYQYAPQWVSVIWKMLKEDSSEVEDEFGEFLTRNVINEFQNSILKRNFLNWMEGLM